MPQTWLGNDLVKQMSVQQISSAKICPLRDGPSLRVLAKIIRYYTVRILI
jgi:hypothetical protein